MSFLTDVHENLVTIGKYRFEVNPAFDTVLSIQQLYREEELTDWEKQDQAIDMLVVSGRRHLKRLRPQEKTALLEEIYKTCVNTRKLPPTRQKERVLDFELDGEYIYASFMLDYRIDLIQMQGILPWKKFIALFQGLSEKTKIREVMRIRGMDTPTFNGKNEKEIQQIQELKMIYALPARGGGGKQGMDRLFYTLEKMAVREGGGSIGEKRR